MKNMSVCDGCGVDTGIECTVTVDNLCGTVVYSFCGFCGDRLKCFIEKEL